MSASSNIKKGVCYGWFPCKTCLTWVFREQQDSRVDHLCRSIDPNVAAAVVAVCSEYDRPRYAWAKSLLLPDVGSALRFDRIMPPESYQVLIPSQNTTSADCVPDASNDIALRFIDIGITSQPFRIHKLDRFQADSREVISISQPLVTMPSGSGQHNSPRDEQKLEKDTKDLSSGSSVAGLVEKTGRTRSTAADDRRRSSFV